MANRIGHKPEGLDIRPNGTAHLLLHEFDQIGPLCLLYLLYLCGHFFRQPGSQLTLKEGFDEQSERSAHFVPQRIMRIHASAFEECLDVGRFASGDIVSRNELR